MLDTIREIGVFMIAAQAVVHFAPGRQYEKYIKSVSGIIVLILFLKPVLRLAGAAWEEPQVLLEKWVDLTDMPDVSVNVQADGVAEEVASRMERELTERLNRELTGDAYFVSRVSIRLILDPEAETGTFLPEITVFLRERAKEESGLIGIEEIVIGQPQEAETGEPFLSYRSWFAALLEMEEERVEVRPDGRG